MTTESSTKRVIVVGDGYVAKNTLASLVSNHGANVEVVAGVPDPSRFDPRVEGVKVIQAAMWDKASLVKIFQEGHYNRVFLILPGHAERLSVGWNALSAAREAGMLQVVLVSVLTADTPPAEAVRLAKEESFRPLDDNIEKLGTIPMALLRRMSSACSSGSTDGDAKAKSSCDDGPSMCVRVQRKNALKGWFPMKVKLLQISLPNLMHSKTSILSKATATSLTSAHADIAQLERELEGPHFPPSSTQPLAMDLLRQQSLTLARPASPGAAFVRQLLSHDSTRRKSSMHRSSFLPFHPILETGVDRGQSNISNAEIPTLGQTDVQFAQILQSLQRQKRQLLQKPCPWL